MSATLRRACIVALALGCAKPTPTPTPTHEPSPLGWFAHPNPQIVGVRISPNEALFLSKYDVETRGAVEYVGGLCMDPLEGAPSPELRTRAAYEPDGTAVLIEETNRPGQCSRVPKNAVTRTVLIPITDRAKIAELEAQARPFFDEKSCERYAACCVDHTRKDWDVHCGRPGRNIPSGCWSHWLTMNEERACPAP